MYGQYRICGKVIVKYDEETEEFIGNVEELTGKIADLTKTAKTPGGISLFSDTAKTQYKSTYQLLKEISAIYKDLTDKDQAALLETLAGKRGGQVLAGVLNDFSEVERAMQNMSQAAGSAEAEMSIIQESIDFKLNALKQTWIGVLQTLIDRGDIDKLLDLLTNISEVIGQIVDNIGLFGTIGVGLGIFELFKNGDKILPTIKNIGTFIRDIIKLSKASKSIESVSVVSEVFSAFNEAGGIQIIDTLDDVTDGLDSVTDAAGTVGKTVSTTGGEVSGLAGSFSTLAGSLGISVGALAATVAVIAGIGLVVGGLIYETKKADKALRESAKNISNEYKTATEDISSYKAQIEVLQNTINDDTKSVDERREARQKLLSVQDEMISKYGQEAGAIEIITDAVNGEIEALDRLTEKQWQKAKNQFNQQDIKGFGDNINRAIHGGASDNIGVMLDEMEDIQIVIEYSNESDKEAIKMLQSLYGGSFGDVGGDEASGIYTLEGNLDDLQEKLLNIQNTADGMDLSVTFTDSLLQNINANNEILDSYGDFYQQLVLNDRIYNSEFEDNYRSMAEKISEYNKTLISDDEQAKKDALNSIVEEYNTLVEEVNNKYDLNDSQQKAIADSIIDLFEGLHPEITVYLNKENLQNQLDEIISGDFVESSRKRIQDINNAISNFSSKEELFHFNKNENSDAILTQSYETIKAVADSAGYSVQQLYEYLLETKQLNEELLSQSVVSSYNANRTNSSPTSDTFMSAISPLEISEKSNIENWIDTDWQKYNLFFSEYKQAGLDTQVAIRAAVVATNNAFKEQANAIKEESDELETWDLDSALAKFDIDKSAFDGYLKKFEELNKLEDMSSESVEKAAVSHYAFDKALEDLRSNLEGYQQELQKTTDGVEDFDRGCISVGESAEALAKDLTALIGVDFSMDDAISFINTADNVDLLTQALDGSNEALMRLKANAIEETIINVDADLNTETFHSQFNELVDFIAQNPNIGSLEAQSYLDSSPFIQECLKLIKEGKMTAAQLEDIFKGLEWSIDFDYENIPMKLPKISLSGDSDYNYSKSMASGGSGKRYSYQNWDKVSYETVNVQVPNNIRFTDKKTVNKPPSDTGGKSGGGGGGGGSSHTPTEPTNKDNSYDRAADSMDEAANAAKEAFEQEKKNAEDLINITWFDWIERLLNVVEKRVNKWTKTIDRMFSYWNKNWAVNNAIKENRNLMTVNSKAYTYYMKQANKAAKKAGMSVESDDENMTLEIVGGEPLKKKYKEDTRTGKISVEEFNGTADSQKLYKKLQAYIEWYDKAQACKEALEDLYDTERQLIEQKLTNILDYYKTLESYLESFSAKLDSLMSVKEASGQRISLQDLLDQYGANSDSIKNLNDEYLAFRVGYNEQNKRSVEEIIEDLRQFKMDLSDSDYYNTLIRRRDELEKKEAAYQDKQDEIAEIKEKIATENDKSAKKQLKKQLSALKAEAKKLKLTKTEKSDLKAVRKQLETLDGDIEDGVVNNVLASTAAYQKLITDIANLEKKDKLSKDQQTKLAMLRDELNAINQGVLVDQLDSYISVYQKWWKLNNKLETKGVLSKNENLQYKQLEEQKTQMELAFRSQKQALEEELNTALQLSGQTQVDLDRAFTQQKKEIEDLYNLRINNTKYSYKSSSAYQKWSQERESNNAAIATQTQIMEKQQAIMDANSSTSKKYKEAKKKYDAAAKKLASLQKKEETYAKQEAAFNAGATDVNFAEYLKAYKEYTESEEYFQKHGKYKDNAQRKAHDAAKNKLDTWNNQKTAEIGMIERELTDTLDRIQKEYESKSNELEKNIADQQAKGWELVRQALELQMNYLEQDIANYEAMVSRYQTIANILANTDMKTIEDYNLADILDIDTSDSLSDLIADNILGALYSAKDKLATHSALYDIYGSLIEAAENQDFSAVLTEDFLGNLSEGAQARLQEMLDQANSNDWNGNAWVQEWASARAQVVSDVANTIDAIQELKDTLRETVVFKATQDAIESLETLNNRLSAMSNIINDEWVQDDNGLTEYGRAKIMLLANEAQNAQDIVRNAAKHIQDVQDAQLNEDTKYANEAEYQKALTEAWSQYSDALQNVYSIDNQIYELSKKQQEAELNRLNKVIDLRKKALASKKEYYDYDKTIKSKTKNIEAIEAELKALNEVNDAASKARYKQLQSDLEEAKEDLEDTKKEHEYDLQIKALDKIVEDFSESMEKSADSIKATFEQWAEQIRQAVSDSSGVDVDKALGDIVSFLMGDYNTSTPVTGNLTTSTTTEVPTVSSEVSSGNLVSLSQAQITNNYLEKLIELQAASQTTISNKVDSLIAVNQDVTNRLVEKANEVMTNLGTVEDVYSLNILNTVQSIDSKFDGKMSDLINANLKSGNSSQQISLSIPSGMSTSQLNKLFAQLRQLGVNFVYK